MVQPIKILLIEDLEADRILLLDEIKKTYLNAEFAFAINEKELTCLLSSFIPDIIISDYNLPAFNGFDALKISQSVCPTTPFILVTGSLNEKIAVDMMKNGADDYIIKDNLKRIGSAIGHSLNVKKERDEKILAQKELRESEERYRGLVELSPDAIIVLKNRYIVFANPAAAEILGVSSSDKLIGRIVLDFIPLKNIPEFERITQALQKKEIFETGLLEQRIIRNTGEEIYVEVFGNVFAEKGSKSIQIIIRNITERKRIENEILKAKEKAEESDKLKTILLSNMSHELRTPMNGILGFSRILNEELKDPELKKSALKIFSSANRLMSTIVSVIHFSELESNNMSVNKKEVKVFPVIRKILESFTEKLDNKNLTITAEETDKNIVALADEMMLSQIIRNIVDNAVKFTNEGGIKISIKQNTNSDNNDAVIIVRDNGIGIAEENIPLIFEPFKQISEGTNRNYEGSGLGLTVAKKMAELMGGRIEVDSIVDKGSVFKIYLPAFVKNENDLEEKIGSGKTYRTSEDKPEILIVEDNYLNKDVAVMFLKNLYKIDHAPTGERAIELAKQKEYKAVLMDINLGPGLDGIEAMKSIRGLDINKNTPVIALTGYAMKGDKERMLSEGFDNYLAKPFERYEIIEIVKLAISK